MEPNIVMIIISMIYGFAQLIAIIACASYCIRNAQKFYKYAGYFIFISIALAIIRTIMST